MMNKSYNTKYYFTRIKNDSAILGGGNEYVRGVIMGIMTSVCVECTNDEFLTWYSRGTVRILKDNHTGDDIYEILTTDELYDKFRSIVDAWYPGLCEFDIFN